RIRKTAPLVPPALVPSSPNPPINKGIESAITTSIKQEFFNTIASQPTLDAVRLVKPAVRYRRKIERTTN
ncbi:hypothetical protein, partial [Cognatishimia sp. MH4019]|uniref:hypothetical protein n=1 Tax=Cognatishimia sp. MH4019 TaxID=2854030 RepID=UPI001CD76BDF